MRVDISILILHLRKLRLWQSKLLAKQDYTAGLHRAGVSTQTHSLQNLSKNKNDSEVSNAVFKKPKQ